MFTFSLLFIPVATFIIWWCISTAKVTLND